MPKYTLPLERKKQEYLAERERFFQELPKLSRRDFFKTAAKAAAVATAFWKGFPPHSFQLIRVAEAKEAEPKFTFAYVSDTHILDKGLNHRFVRACQKAVDDVNALDPQPDFVLFGGDLAQLGKAEELTIGKQILDQLKAPVKMMVGEHDWYLDMGEKWREMFGEPTYSFDHKGVHFIVLNSVIVEDYWTEPKMTPMERMLAMAQLDNPNGRPFMVGEEQRDWLRQDLAKVNKKTPIVIFSHSPLYKYYRPWNFWTEDAEEVHKLLAPFETVTVIHAHTHQVLTHRLRNITFHGVLSTAWPWPYAPQGIPELTVQMVRADPFNQFDGCGWGSVSMRADGQADKHYVLWDRNPMTVTFDHVRRGKQGMAELAKAFQGRVDWPSY
ncbi:MAG: serine/threonine protein phosphatase [Candidatus Binatia bacterium]|nr:MAG: serine/threonine protein phosphatase [Candidatus Binatia bacterium]